MGHIKKALDSLAIRESKLQCPSCSLDVCALCALSQVCEECGTSLDDDFVDLFWKEESALIDELDGW